MNICLIWFLLMVSTLEEPNMYQNLVGFTRIVWVVEGVFKKLVIIQFALLKNNNGKRLIKLKLLGTIWYTKVIVLLW